MDSHSSEQLERVSWRDGHGTAAANVFATVACIEGRERPCCIATLAAHLVHSWSLLERPHLRQGQEVQRFVRPVWGSPSVLVGNQFLLVRQSILPTLRTLATFRSVPAVCVGLLDFDPFDQVRLQALRERWYEEEEFGGIPSGGALADQIGRRTEEADWTLVESRYDCVHDRTDTVEFDFRNAIENSVPKADDLFVGCLSPQRWSKSLLAELGLWHGQQWLMTKEVAELVMPHAPPPFWRVDWWRYCD